MAREPVEATAFHHRRARIMVNLAAFYDGPEDRAVRETWVADFAADLHQEDSGAYVWYLHLDAASRCRYLISEAFSSTNRCLFLGIDAFSI